MPENPQLLAGRPLRSCGRVCTVFAKPAANRSCHHVPQAIEPWLSDQPPANSAHPDKLHLLHAPPRKHIDGHGRDRCSTGLATKSISSRALHRHPLSFRHRHPPPILDIYSNSIHKRTPAWAGRGASLRGIRHGVPGRTTQPSRSPLLYEAPQRPLACAQITLIRQHSRL